MFVHAPTWSFKASAPSKAFSHRVQTRLRPTASSPSHANSKATQVAIERNPTDASLTSRRLVVSTVPLLTVLRESPAVAEESSEEAAVLDGLATSAAEGVSKVFVAGATGQTGRRVVLELRKRGIPCRGGVRDVKKAEALGIAVSKPGETYGPVELVKFDVTSDERSLINAIGDADTIVCATGFTPTLKNLGGLKPGAADAVDRLGTISLVKAAKKAGVKHFVLVSSLLTNAPAVGQGDNQNYKVLNAFGGVLDAKRDAELYLQDSGVTYTIIRPGGLSNDPPSGGLIVSGEDTLFGADGEVGREISRDQVAEVCVEALLQTAADNKVIEIVSSPTVPTPLREAWFVV